MKKVTYVLWLLIGWLAGGCWLPSCAGNEPVDDSAPHVLIIQSYRSDCLWGDELNRGVRDCFRKMDQPAVFDTYYLDSESLSEAQMTEQLSAHLDDIRRPDLILVSADQALGALLKTNHLLSFEVPVVFSGVNYQLPESIKEHLNISGFTYFPDYRKCIGLVRELFPTTRKISLDVDGTVWSGLAAENFIRETAGEEGIAFEITRMEESEGLHFLLQPRDWRDEVRIMPVWSSFYFGYARQINVPYFAVNSKGIGLGYLGGYMTLSYDQMYSAAEIGVRLLRGESISNFPIREGVQQPVFDWQQLQKYHIPVSRLPEGSVLINQSFTERYRMEMICAGLFLGLAVLSITLVLLFLSRVARKTKKKTQEELFVHRNKLTIVMSSIREGVISVDRQLNLFAINPSAVQMLGLESDGQGCIGKTILDIIDLADGKWKGLEELIREVFSTGKTITFADDCRMGLRAGKRYFPVSGAVSAIWQHNQLYGAVLVFTDDTEAYARKEFLALTLKAGGYTSWRLDPVRNLILLDPAFMKANGIYNDGLDAVSLTRMRETIHPDDVEEWESVVRRIIGRTLDKFDLTIRLNVDGNGYQSWEINFTCLRTVGSKEIPLIFGLCCNVEESVQALRALEQAREKAQLSDRLKSAFLANMSHEIRTPLNAIVGFSNVLTSGDELDADERQLFVNTIRNNCTLLLGLISDVLDMAQIESGTMHYKDEVCDVNEFIEQIIVTQQVIVPDRIRLISRIPGDTSYFMADKLRLNQVITNLINNAVKFTDKGSVTVGYTREGGCYHFFVEDTGKGIPAKDVDNVFKRFFKKDDFAQGAGLGLSICKMIVDHYQGSIHVASKEGVGSRFTVSIPFAEVERGNAPDTHGKKQNTIYKLLDMNTMNDNQLSQDRVTLLIAEDEESNYLLLKTVLQKQCNLIRAKTGKEALELYQENAAVISLIMLDIKMPEMTGIEALKEIRKITKDIPVIMQSAYVFDTDMEAARQAGATDFITKPINLKILKATISRFCPSVQW